MMKSKLSTFLKVFNDIVENNHQFLIFTRGIEFQKQAINEFESLLKKTQKLKRTMIKSKDEKSSNILLSLENLLSAYISELKMYVFLKEDDMDKAWESLVTAQYSIRTAFQADDIVSSYDGELYMEKLELIEVTFFPRQTFNSIEAIVEKSECSICGQDYGKCAHVKGRPYMGQICYRKITKMKLQGVSILVTNPANKMCRVIHFSDKGYMRDVLTWRITKDSKKK
jgi:hypothetical protein